jgi:hypothetical protein
MATALFRLYSTRNKETIAGICFNVHDFGNDIQAAINCLPPSGGIVYVPLEIYAYISAYTFIAISNYGVLDPTSPYLYWLAMLVLLLVA